MDNVTNRLLDAAKAAQGGISDYALAAVLKVHQTAISNYRNGRTQMNDEIACRIAALLGERPGAVLASLAMERAKSEDVRKVWKDAVKRLGGVAASFALAVGAASFGIPQPAAAGQLNNNGLVNLHCAKTRRRWWQT